MISVLLDFYRFPQVKPEKSGEYLCIGFTNTVQCFAVMTYDAKRQVFTSRYMVSGWADIGVKPIELSMDLMEDNPCPPPPIGDCSHCHRKEYDCTCGAYLPCRGPGDNLCGGECDRCK